MKYLKSFLLMALFTFSSIFVFAQKDSNKVENDTLNLGIKKIIIIDATEDLQTGVENLQDGIVNFRVKVANIKKDNLILEDSIRIAEEKIKLSSDKEEIEVLEEKIESWNEQVETNEDKIEAFEEGIEGIEDEIDGLKDELEELTEVLVDMENDFNPFKSKKKKFRGHWTGLNFGINNFLNSNYEMALPAGGEFMDIHESKSYNFSFNFVQFNIPLFSKYMGFVTGMGIEWNNYSLKQNIDLFEDQNNNGYINYVEIDPEDMNYTKNILRSIYLNVPLIYEFQIPVTKRDKRINIGLGVIGSMKIGSKFKKIYEIDGNKQKIKLNEDYQISPFRYSATLRIGFRALQLYANYSLVPLFEKNKGPELYPVSVGIRIGF